jgi:hypothetical protein
MKAFILVALAVAGAAQADSQFDAEVFNAKLAQQAETRFEFAVREYQEVAPPRHSQSSRQDAESRVCSEWHQIVSFYERARMSEAYRKWRDLPSAFGWQHHIFSRRVDSMAEDCQEAGQ